MRSFISFFLAVVTATIIATTLGCTAASTHDTISSVKERPKYKNYRPRGEHITAEELARLIKQFYNSKGEWAGTFRMQSVDKLEVTPEINGNFLAHVKYRYVPVPGNRRGRTDSGYDERAFSILRRGNTYTVSRMHGHMSACFGCTGHKTRRHKTRRSRDGTDAVFAIDYEDIPTIKEGYGKYGVVKLPYDDSCAKYREGKGFPTYDMFPFGKVGKFPWTVKCRKSGKIWQATWKSMGSYWFLVAGENIDITKKWLTFDDMVYSICGCAPER